MILANTLFFVNKLLLMDDILYSAENLDSYFSLTEAVRKQLNGSIEYYSKGILTRITKPCGTTVYYNKKGEIHRDNLPAIINPRGDEYYYEYNLLHRLNGPAIITVNGDVHYYQKGMRHREDGPAITYNDGHVYYFLYDLLHRLDGPAIVTSWGECDYYYEGLRYKPIDYYKLPRRLEEIFKRK